MYIVLHSQDPHLLARMATDLQMGNYRIHVLNMLSPFDADVYWLAIYGGISFSFHTHNCKSHEEKRFDISESNYTEVLQFILENKDK